MSERAPASHHQALAEMVVTDYGAVADHQGISTQDLVASFPLGREDSSKATLDLDGTPVDSYRFQVGVLSDTDRSRGGLELSTEASDEKILHKAFTMQGKHDFAEDGNIGGKSGMRVTPEQMEYLKTNPKARRDLFAQHAEAHDINPHTNVVATDFNTFGGDMDAIADALQRKYGELAGAAASGVSKKYGGEPELHADKTGLGGDVMMHMYFAERAKTDPRVAEAMNGGKPLRALVQGLGKAGSHFLVNMPEYIQPVGAMEGRGALVAANGNYLDRKQLLEMSRATMLSEEVAGAVNDSFWLPSTTEGLREFWSSGHADIIVPAYNRGQYVDQDAENFDGMLVVGMANEATSPEVQAILDSKGVDELVDVAANLGGTLSSQRIWEKFMNPGNWTPQQYQERWYSDIQGVGKAMIQQRRELSLGRGGEFVPLREAVGHIVVANAFGKLQQHRR